MCCDISMPSSKLFKFEDPKFSLFATNPKHVKFGAFKTIFLNYVLQKLKKSYPEHRRMIKNWIITALIGFDINGAKKWVGHRIVEICNKESHF